MFFVGSPPGPKIREKHIVLRGILMIWQIPIGNRGTDIAELVGIS
jgi:hypothetical protein